MRYIAFDVETPNYANDRMSAIGISIVEDGKIIRNLSTLVNPEARFDAFNIELTGITPEMAATAPTFAQLWPRLQQIMDGNILIAHNAPFDMSVLAKCLRDYGIQWRPQVQYACTCRMSKHSMPELPNHKLNTVCDSCGIELEHHQAASDAHACACILLECQRRGARIEEYLRTYDMTQIRTLCGKSTHR